MSTAPNDDTTQPSHPSIDAATPRSQAAGHHTPQDAAPDDADSAMKDQLRKDVASWREARSDGAGRQATDLSVAVARSIVPPTNARMKRAKPTTTEAKPDAGAKKPFGMSYDGTSRADYIKLMISRGAR